MKQTALVAGVLLSLAAGSLPAQGVRVGVSGGVVSPLGHYKDNDKLGWLAGADVTYWLMGAPVGIRAEGSYSQTIHKDVNGTAVEGNSKIFGGAADLVYAFGKTADPVRLYVLGGIGFYNVKVTIPALSVDSSESQVGFGGGAGLAFKLGTGSTRVFVEGKFVSVSTSGDKTTFLPIRAGLRFGGK